MSSSKWNFYKDNLGEWRWRKAANDGKTLDASNEGFYTRRDAVKNARLYGFTGVVGYFSNSFRKTKDK